jgi:hypothetical protein
VSKIIEFRPQKDLTSLRGHTLRLASLLLGLWLTCFAPAAWAQTTQDPPQNPPQESPKVSEPAPVSKPANPEQTNSAAPTDGCPQRPAAGVNEAANILVVLEPHTLWRPRGSEVHFTVGGKDGATIQVKRVQVCMGWSFAHAHQTDQTVPHGLRPSPLVHLVKADGSELEYGAVVPNLKPIPTFWPLRLFSRGEVAFTAISTVPIADMVVEVTLSDKSKTVVVLPVGVTSVTYGIVLAVLAVAAFFVAAWALMSRSAIPGRNLLLKIICTQDGFASLSQFQIMLWTIIVGASAVYVMVLSGNLINLTDGTLVLLGITGGAALLARVPGRTDPPQPAQAGAAQPQWSDLVVVDDTIDVTRVQMLIFTMISASFVALKVIVDYAIPDIPLNFLLLMGISNGIYVIGRQLPNQTK